jgi:hypothetical protein
MGNSSTENHTILVDLHPAFVTPESDLTVPNIVGLVYYEILAPAPSGLFTARRSYGRPTASKETIDGRQIRDPSLFTDPTVLGRW